MLTVKDHIKGFATFQHFQDGNLIYKTDSGFEFPVPVEDCGSARFHAVEKGIMLMRWINKQMIFLAKNAA